MTTYIDDAGIVYMGRFLRPENRAAAEVDIVTLFESKPSNSAINVRGGFHFSFNNEPVDDGFDLNHILYNEIGLDLCSSISSGGTRSRLDQSNPTIFSDTMFAVFAKGVLAVFKNDQGGLTGGVSIFLFGELEISAFPTPLNRFVITPGAAKWVNQVNATTFGGIYTDEPEASFPINCSGGGTADATWLKVLDKVSGKAVGVCEGTVMQTEGTNFVEGEYVQVDAPLPDGGSRIFVCAGSWGDDGQILVRVAPFDADEYTP